MLLLLAVAGGVAMAALGVRGIDGETPRSGPKPIVGLVTSLPIYWPEGSDVGALLTSEQPVPWVRAALERDYVLEPVDFLGVPDPQGADGASEAAAMAGLQHIAIIQPRGLSPADNVAIDAWVRSGGHLLLALDPMLTGHYTTPIFDPSHPTSIALIPPVVERWGLSMQFDETQPLQPRLLETQYGELSTLLAGELSLIDPADGACVLDGEGVLAYCAIGEGRVTLLADAGLFELDDPGERGARMVRGLFAQAFE